MNPPKEEARDVIYLELDDEITTIFERIRTSRFKKIALVIPSRAQVLQSLVSLKILRFKSENAEKEVVVVTKDDLGREVAKEAGFATAESVKLKGNKVKVDAFRKASEASRKPHAITRKQLKIQEFVDKAKAKLRRLNREEIPLGEIHPKQGVKKVWDKLSGSVIAEEDGGGQHFVVKKPSRRIFFALLAASAVLLFFIIYIAVPSATIYVTPRADPISKTVNVTFTDKVSNTGPQPVALHSIPAEFFNFNFEKDIRIGATGMLFEGSNARGKITIYNRSPRDKFIVPSRFLSKEGIVFKTLKAVTIPKRIGDVNGSIEVEVEACEKDDTECDCINEPETCAGDFVGVRGNIEPSFFTIPAIPSLSPSLYWGESTVPFAGGVTKITKFISQEDLDNAEATVVFEITNLALQELRDLVAQKNKMENRNLVLLEDKKAIEVEVLGMQIPDDLLDRRQDDFVVSVRARVQGVAYEEDDLRDLLFNQLETKVHPDKDLVKINFENASNLVEEVNLQEGRVKSAVTVEGVEEYALNEESEAGIRLVGKIKNRILGRNVKESEAYIRNLPEVSDAIISSWPFWARNIPDLAENVKFRIKR